ncbi:MAG: hypothetical protein M3Z24_12270 [Chloroflexota bacterium]|nr:hypothetical protein [Chloroflexota bacterium]
MSITRPQQGGSASNGGSSSSLMYAPPPSTVSNPFQQSSLFAPSSVASPRHSGHAQARRHPAHVSIVYPEHYHQRYRLPTNVELQPF